tara:strand:- start:2281 stop:2505 length:225 start_codon:yes stop_codon:yes gene_type:complete
MEIKPNEMEFIDEMATQITEMNFGADTFVDWANLDKTKENAIKFSDEAQEYYNEMYDEYEDLYISMILQIPKKI